MPKETIKNVINELNSTVDQDASLSAENKESLNQISDRLQMMLSGATENWEENLVDELERQVILYEESHPVVARIFNQLILTLNSMGL